jgi:hypothetical protein
MPRYQYPLEVHGLQTILDEGVQVEDLEAKDLLLMILAELKVMNEHLALITNEEIDIDEEMEA